ncbi:MAG: LptF/LptG family permease [Bacteroides sp.]|nr:LptF/LptG family permease [Bacteroides sp.]
MKKIDWYIIKKFLGTFFFAMALIILIVIVFDFSEKIDDFIEKQAPLREIIFSYYLNFIPYFVNLFSPLFTFIAVIFFTSRLATNTEIVAMLSAGISFRRLMVPYLISAILLGMLSFYLANIIIPPANKRRLDFEAVYVKNPATFRERNIHMQIRPGVFIFLESYNDRSNMGWRFSLEKIEEGELVYKLSADNIRWDSINGSWGIENYYLRTIDGLQEELRFGNRLDTVLPFTPRDFIQNLKEMETMNFSELRDYIRNERLKGSENVKFYEVEMYRRAAFPFATLVLTLICVALSSRKVRGGIGLHLGAGLAFSFAFILFMQISTTFATKGNLSPLLSVWIPNIIFGLVGIYLYQRAPK